MGCEKTNFFQSLKKHKKVDNRSRFFPELKPIWTLLSNSHFIVYNTAKIFSNQRGDRFNLIKIE